MSLNYLYFGSYWRNLTSPITHWQRGTTVQIDTVKDHPELQVVVGQLGTDIVVLTMAARITQSIFTLARNLLHKRPWGWRIIPGDWRNKVFQAVLWVCWKIIGSLLTVEVTNMVVYKNFAKPSTRARTEKCMNTVSINCHWGCKADLNQQTILPELLSPKMEKLQGNTDLLEACDHKVFSDMDIMVSKETLLPSCTNPFILSMIYVPSEDGESSLPSEESEISDFESDSESDSECLPSCEESSLSESESGDEEENEKSSLDDTSGDSGMQESWTPKSKEDVDGSEEEESDWSDEDDSWDAASDVEHGEEDELWASFCRNDDPYNPLSFAMPTRSTKQVKEVPHASTEKHQIRGKSCPSIPAHKDQASSCRSRAKKPVLSSFKCSHKCANQKDEPGPIELNHTGVKKVRFSSSVAVHHMVTWSYAYRMARKGPWEEYARDRSRFLKRVAETEAAINFCLQPQHREKIWATRHCQD